MIKTNKVSKEQQDLVQKLNEILSCAKHPAVIHHYHDRLYIQHNKIALSILQDSFYPYHAMYDYKYKQILPDFAPSTIKESMLKTSQGNKFFSGNKDVDLTAQYKLKDTLFTDPLSLVFCQVEHTCNETKMISYIDCHHIILQNAKISWSFPIYQIPRIHKLLRLLLGKQANIRLDLLQNDTLQISHAHDNEPPSLILQLACIKSDEKKTITSA